MNVETKNCEIRPFPSSRRLVIDSCEWGRKKHIIHALTECDVTRARAIMRDHKSRTGEGLSLTAFMAACIGRAVAENRICHAYRKGRKLVLFHDVDIGTLVEHDVDGEKLATIHVIRGADKKTFRQIHDEIRAAQKESVESAPGVSKWKVFVRLPAVLRRLFYRWLDRSPETRKRLGGTVVLTAIGMAGSGAGWGLPIASNTLSITLGGIETKPGFIDGRIEPREYLCMTVSVDHDIVDGIPAARFASRLRQIAEEAAILS
jgi:pyruvate/2-oxoglutarate dehydrogenase complex dihydrolipoamide acyltransferase (E2) component